MALTALPAVARAEPGAVEEYVLDAPTAKGDDHADASGIPPSASGGAPPAAPATAPAPAPAGEEPRDRNKADSGQKTSPANSRSADTGGDSPLSALGGELTSSSDSGTGPLLPILLGLTLAGALAFLVVRRRRGGEG